MAKLAQIDTWLASLGDKKAVRELKKHAKQHHGQQLRMPPLLPVHAFVFDPMHGVHNEANILLDEAIHKHLMVKSTKEVNKVIEETTLKVNKLWKDAGLSKFIQFGRDKQGAHSHALNGPAFKDVWRRPQLIIDTIKLMQPVYALLESKKLTPEMKPEAVGDGADKAPPAAGKAKDQAKKTGGGSRKSKARRVQYSDDEAEEEQPGEGSAAAAAAAAAEGNPQNEPAISNSLTTP